MEPSHVLPLRPVPKIQTMFSGLTPPGDRRARERRDSPFLTARRKARLNLGVKIVPPTPSGGLLGHKVIATIYSHKTYLHAMGHYTLTEPCLGAPDSPVSSPTLAKLDHLFAQWVTIPLNNSPSL
jgi:hypothetical protein